MKERRIVGPILLARGADARAYRMAALLAVPDGTAAPPLVPGVAAEPVRPSQLYHSADWTVWRYDFSLPVNADATYRLGDEVYRVAADLTGDVRVAYVSCNGQEEGDHRRPVEERNAMWRRLADEHDEAPFGVMLQGGDQLYADEVLNAHPILRRWAKCRTAHKARHAFSDDARAAAERFYVERYITLFSQPGIAHLCARVPSLMMWDDHDIIDGWGSHPTVTLDSPVGQGLFEVARRAFAVFQLGLSVDEVEQAGSTFGFAVRFPGLTVVAPDLRSERRPNRVMGPASWAAFERDLSADRPGDRLLLMSSVPALGPRLSWVERLMTVFPGIRKYKDDLRDQWQSRAHRAEWQRFLRTLEAHSERHGCGVTAVSGEIHLATRGEMPFRSGKMLHQLVASGIAHPAPPAAYAFGLGLLASLGEDPLPGQPIRLHPLPGRSWIYSAERNYLVLERAGDDWFAHWELENSGRTDPLKL